MLVALSQWAAYIDMPNSKVAILNVFGPVCGRINDRPYCSDCLKVWQKRIGKTHSNKEVSKEPDLVKESFQENAIRSLEGD